jgi:hypothetical protein
MLISSYSRRATIVQPRETCNYYYHTKLEAVFREYSAVLFGFVILPDSVDLKLSRFRASPPMRCGDSCTVYSFAAKPLNRQAHSGDPCSCTISPTYFRNIFVVISQSLISCIIGFPWTFPLSQRYQIPTGHANHGVYAAFVGSKEGKQMRIPRPRTADLTYQL